MWINAGQPWAGYKGLVLEKVLGEGIKKLTDPEQRAGHVLGTQEKEGDSRGVKRLTNLTKEECDNILASFISKA